MSYAPDVAFIFDSDALIQIFIAGQQELLRMLREDYGVSCYLMNEVEVELRKNPKFSSLIRPRLEKALKHKYISLLSSSELERLAPPDTEPVSLAEIRELGQEYAMEIGPGEAFTHAAAILLDVPSVSNDMNAIKILETRGRRMPRTILRSFDLFAFFYIEKQLTTREVEHIRKDLLAQGEWVPPSIKNASFEDGIGSIRCRLETSMAISASSTHWSGTFFLKRRDTPSDDISAT